MANDMTPIGDGRFFELTSFLEGESRAWGIFEDRFGRVRRRIDVTMIGRWDGDVFRLDEHFVYDDGRREHRVWTVKPDGPGKFRATCDDCVGEAIGTCAADSIRMAYAFKLKLPSRTLVVDFDDRIYRMSATTAVNRATMRKWGIKLGELSLFFERKTVVGMGARGTG